VPIPLPQPLRMHWQSMSPLLFRGVPTGKTREWGQRNFRGSHAPQPPPESFFTVEVIQGIAPKNSPFRNAHTPLLAIRIVDGFADGIVRHDEQGQILQAIVNELMRLAWLEKKRIARLNGAGGNTRAHL